MSELRHEAAGAAAVVGQSAAAAGGEDGDGGEQFAELTGARRIEGAEGAAAEPRDLLEREPRHRIAALVEHEAGHAQKPQPAGQLAEKTGKAASRAEEGHN